MIKSLPICVCVTRDGSRCGRRVSDGSNPPVCHVHRAQQEGKRVGALTEPSPFDPETTLRRIAADRKHPNQVQAIRLLLDREKCRACAARAEGEVDFQKFWRNVTDDEKARLKVISAEIKQIKADVRKRIKGTEQ